MKSNDFSALIMYALRSAVALMFFATSFNVYADNTDSNLAVGASIANACAITTAPIAFGAYDSVLKAQINTTGSVTVTCTNGASAFVKLGQGLNGGVGSTDAVPVRRMLSGTVNFLPYSLSTVADQSVVWEMTTGVAHAGTGNATIMTVYGRIAANANVPAGTYADTVVARVTF